MHLHTIIVDFTMNLLALWSFCLVVSSMVYMSCPRSLRGDMRIYLASRTLDPSTTAAIQIRRTPYLSRSRAPIPHCYSTRPGRPEAAGAQQKPVILLRCPVRRLRRGQTKKIPTGQRFRGGHDCSNSDGQFLSKPRLLEKEEQLHAHARGRKRASCSCRCSEHQCLLFPSHPRRFRKATRGSCHARISKAGC